MHAITISPLKKPIEATVSIPGSKSYTNRALIMAALTKGAVTLTRPLYSEDTKAMIGCLRTLGLRIEEKPDSLIVHDDLSAIEDKSYELFAHDSGTTIRFMLALLCIVPGTKTIQGSQRLNERPIRDLVEALQGLGAKIEYVKQDGALPVKISSSHLSQNTVQLKGDLSSQFCSALLLISPMLARGLTIEIVGDLISKPYVDMTVGCMKEWGVEVQEREGKGYVIPPNQAYQQEVAVIEGDYSSAGYFFAIAALTESTITVHNLNPNSLQADRHLLDILAEMGAHIRYHEESVTVRGRGISPLSLDMERCPDQVMTVAVLASFADGVTMISGVRSLRYKETERVVAIKTELAKMGIKTEDTYDTLAIYGGFPHGAQIDTYNDHRMAMAFAVAGMHLEGIVIRNPEVVNKTFPDFWDRLKALR